MPEAKIEAFRPTPCTATAIRKASRRVTQLYDDALEPSGLRSTQFAILAKIAARRGTAPTILELASAMVMDQSALGHNLRPLEREDYVRLVTSADDKRRRHVVLTAAGKTKCAEARKLWRKAQANFNHIFG